MDEGFNYLLEMNLRHAHLFASSGRIQQVHLKTKQVTNTRSSTSKTFCCLSKTDNTKKIGMKERTYPITRYRNSYPNKTPQGFCSKRHFLVHMTQNRALIRLELPGTNVIHTHTQKKKDYQKLIKSHPNITIEEYGLNKRHDLEEG